jgi:hypothetical protein
VTRSLLISLVICLAVIGCITGGASTTPNSSFDLSVSDAKIALREMRDDPKPLERPLVILGGYHDPGLAASHLRGEFKKLTGDKRVLGVSFMFCGNFDDCKRDVIAAVDKAFPSDDPIWTTEVDVIGVSMGGLVGRYSALADPFAPDGRRLKIARMFTIGTPHRGASMAGMPTFNSLQIDMRANSKFLRSLDRRERKLPKAAQYEIYPYVRLGDVIVGAENAAPEGQHPLWVPAEPLQDSHMFATMDARIIADMARRLRGEEPFAVGPPQPLPGQTSDESPQAVQAKSKSTPPHGTSFALQ